MRSQDHARSVDAVTSGQSPTHRVTAGVNSAGQEFIWLHPISPRGVAFDLGHIRACAGRLRWREWQAAAYHHSELRSGIVRDFGLGWFNRARAAIAKAEAAQ